MQFNKNKAFNRSITVFILFVLIGFTEIQSQSAELTFVPGLYKISGSHSQYGNYHGFLLIKKNSEVQRIIRFNSLTIFQNQEYTIEQLWQGHQNSTNIQFQIRTSNVLTSFNGYTPLNNDLSFESVSLAHLNSKFELRNDGEYAETYTFFSKSEDDLFIKDSRTKLDSKGETSSLLVDLAAWIGVNNAIKEYRKLPHFNDYRDREDFKNNQTYRIKDLTDLLFYRSTTSILRIRNMSLTPLSIGEALQRRAAFQPTLKDKADFKQKETRSLMNDLGIFEEGTISANSQEIILRPQGDTALWFGVYIWSLALENRTTKTLDSYQRLKSAIESLNHLIEISPDPTIFARYIHKSPANEIWPDPNIRQGTGRYNNYKYDSRSNNDMVKGFLLGYLIAYKSLKIEDQELRNKVATLVRRIQQLDPIQKKAGNHALAKGLDALWNNDVTSLKEFIDGSNSFTSILSEKLYIDSGFHVGGMTNPSGIHLNLISQSIRYYLAEALIQKVNEFKERMYIPIPQSETSPSTYEDPKPRLKAIKESAANNIKNLSIRMRKAFFNYLNIAAYAITNDPSLRQRALDSIWGLIEVPKVRSVGQMYGDLSLQPDWMYSSWPFEPWTALKGPWLVDKEKLSKKNQRRGFIDYPVFECAGMSSTYLWVDGTNDFPCSGNANNIAFSADYLWAYWIARSANIITEHD